MTKSIFFVNPSYSEGLPRSVLEAAAAGRCIIATDVGGTKEIIGGEESAGLIGLADANQLALKIKHLLDNPHLVEERGRQVQKKVEQEFSWDKVTDKYLNLFQNVRYSGKNLF